TGLGVAPPHLVPVRSVGADDGDQHYDAGIGEQAGDLADPTDVLGAVLGRETQVGVQAVADVGAVEPVGGPALGDQCLLDRGGDRRLARSGQTGQPDRGTRATRSSVTLLAGDSAFLPDDVSGHYS